ncbi:outer membrane protein [Methylobacterium flocculans]|uniref:outer membrane protein n=1 Tax=Methylobacterium flocculans TaxID=2984843 RepID=UPI0021F34440|nr:porin family protein [Methylobacterium sp. FF17]
MRQTLLAGATGILLCGAASAADLPRRAAPPVFVPVPVFTWTGFYLGVNAGYAFSENSAIRTTGNNGPGAGALIGPAFTSTVGNVLSNRRPGSFRSEQEGFTGGGGIGYNYQFTPGSGIVVGIEADAQYTDLERTRTFISSLNDPSTFRQSLDFLGTVRGRLGYAFDKFLVYGTGGFAYGSVNYSADFFGNAAARPLAYSGRFSQMETGYVYGGGIEYAIPTDSFLNFFKASAVTVKAEYLRYDLGTRNVIVNQTNLAPVTGSYTSRFSTEGSLVRAGINYKFGSY